MRYEFDEPFIVDASRAETELGLRATSLTDAVEQTVRWYRAQATPSSTSHRTMRHVAPGTDSNRHPTRQPDRSRAPLPQRRSRVRRAER